eukprot:3756225-Rhodomonas_salina.2
MGLFSHLWHSIADVWNELSVRRPRRAQGLFVAHPPLLLRVQGSRFTVYGSPSTVQGSRFTDQGLGFTVCGSGLRVHGSRFIVFKCGQKA